MDPCEAEPAGKVLENGAECVPQSSGSLTSCRGRGTATAQGDCPQDGCPGLSQCHCSAFDDSSPRKSQSPPVLQEIGQSVPPAPPHDGGVCASEQVDSPNNARVGNTEVDDSKSSAPSGGGPDPQNEDSCGGCPPGSSLADRVTPEERHTCETTGVAAEEERLPDLDMAVHGVKQVNDETADQEPPAKFLEAVGIRRVSQQDRQSRDKETQFQGISDISEKKTCTVPLPDGTASAENPSNTTFRDSIQTHAQEVDMSAQGTSKNNLLITDENPPANSTSSETSIKLNISGNTFTVLSISPISTSTTISYEISTDDDTTSIRCNPPLNCSLASHDDRPLLERLPMSNLPKVCKPGNESEKRDEFFEAIHGKIPTVPLTRCDERVETISRQNEFLKSFQVPPAVQLFPASPHLAEKPAQSKGRVKCRGLLQPLWAFLVDGDDPPPGDFVKKLRAKVKSIKNALLLEKMLKGEVACDASVPKPVADAFRMITERRETLNRQSTELEKTDAGSQGAAETDSLKDTPIRDATANASEENVKVPTEVPAEKSLKMIFCRDANGNTISARFSFSVPAASKSSDKCSVSKTAKRKAKRQPKRSRKTCKVSPGESGETLPGLTSSSSALCTNRPLNEKKSRQSPDEEKLQSVECLANSPRSRTDHPGKCRDMADDDAASKTEVTLEDGASKRTDTGDEYSAASVSGESKSAIDCNTSSTPSQSTIKDPDVGSDQVSDIQATVATKKAVRGGDSSCPAPMPGSVLDTGTETPEGQASGHNGCSDIPSRAADGGNPCNYTTAGNESSKKKRRGRKKLPSRYLPTKSKPKSDGDAQNFERTAQGIGSKPYSLAVETNIGFDAPLQQECCGHISSEVPPSKKYKRICINSDCIRAYLLRTQSEDSKTGASHSKKPHHGEIRELMSGHTPASIIPNPASDHSNSTLKRTKERTASKEIHETSASNVVVTNTWAHSCKENDAEMSSKSTPADENIINVGDNTSLQLKKESSPSSKQVNCSRELNQTLSTKSRDPPYTKNTCSQPVPDYSNFKSSVDSGTVSADYRGNSSPSAALSGLAPKIGGDETPSAAGDNQGERTADGSHRQLPIHGTKYSQIDAFEKSKSDRKACEGEAPYEEDQTRAASDVILGHHQHMTVEQKYPRERISENKAPADGVRGSDNTPMVFDKIFILEKDHSRPKFSSKRTRNNPLDHDRHSQKRACTNKVSVTRSDKFIREMDIRHVASSESTVRKVIQDRHHRLLNGSKHHYEDKICGRKLAAETTQHSKNAQMTFDKIFILTKEKPDLRSSGTCHKPSVDAAPGEKRTCPPKKRAREFDGKPYGTASTSKHNRVTTDAHERRAFPRSGEWILGLDDWQSWHRASTRTLQGNVGKGRCDRRTSTSKSRSAAFSRESYTASAKGSNNAKSCAFRDENAPVADDEHVCLQDRCRESCLLPDLGKRARLPEHCIAHDRGHRCAGHGKKPNLVGGSKPHKHATEGKPRAVGCSFQGVDPGKCKSVCDGIKQKTTHDGIISSHDGEFRSKVFSPKVENGQCQPKSGHVGSGCIQGTERKQFSSHCGRVQTYQPKKIDGQSPASLDKVFLLREDVQEMPRPFYSISKRPPSSHGSLSSVQACATKRSPSHGSQVYFLRLNKAARRSSQEGSIKKRAFHQMSGGAYKHPQDGNLSVVKCLKASLDLNSNNNCSLLDEDETQTSPNLASSDPAGRTADSSSWETGNGMMGDGELSPSEVADENVSHPPLLRGPPTDTWCLDLLPEPMTGADPGLHEQGGCISWNSEASEIHTADNSLQPLADTKQFSQSPANVSEPCQQSTHLEHGFDKTSRVSLVMSSSDAARQSSQLPVGVEPKETNVRKLGETCGSQQKQNCSAGGTTKSSADADVSIADYEPSKITSEFSRLCLPSTTPVDASHCSRLEREEAALSPKSGRADSANMEQHCFGESLKFLTDVQKTAEGDQHSSRQVRLLAGSSYSRQGVVKKSEPGETSKLNFLPSVTKTGSCFPGLTLPAATSSHRSRFKLLKYGNHSAVSAAEMISESIKDSKMSTENAEDHGDCSPCKRRKLQEATSLHQKPEEINAWLNCFKRMPHQQQEQTACSENLLKDVSEAEADALDGAVQTGKLGRASPALAAASSQDCSQEVPVCETGDLANDAEEPRLSETGVPSTSNTFTAQKLTHSSKVRVIEREAKVLSDNVPGTGMENARNPGTSSKLRRWKALRPVRRVPCRAAISDGKNTDGTVAPVRESLKEDQPVTRQEKEEVETRKPLNVEKDPSRVILQDERRSPKMGHLGKRKAKCNSNLQVESQLKELENERFAMALNIDVTESSNRNKGARRKQLHRFHPNPCRKQDRPDHQPKEFANFGLGNTTYGDLLENQTASLYLEKRMCNEISVPEYEPVPRFKWYNFSRSAFSEELEESDSFNQSREESPQETKGLWRRFAEEKGLPLGTISERCSSWATDKASSAISSSATLPAGSHRHQDSAKTSCCSRLYLTLTGLPVQNGSCNPAPNSKLQGGTAGKRRARKTPPLQTGVTEVKTCRASCGEHLPCNVKTEAERMHASHTLRAV